MCARSLSMRGPLLKSTGVLVISCSDCVLDLLCKGPCFNPKVHLQFQKRQYAKVGKIPCGKKGHGLKLLQDMSKGQFLIEYVGEVTLEFFSIIWLCSSKVNCAWKHCSFYFILFFWSFHYMWNKEVLARAALITA